MSMRPSCRSRTITRPVRPSASRSTGSAGDDLGRPERRASSPAPAGISGSSMRASPPLHTVSVTGSGDGHAHGQ